MKELKLYVWEDVMRDYGPGLAVALASSKEQAIQLIVDKADQLEGLGDYAMRHLQAAEPLVIERPEGFYVTGGG